MFDRLTTAVVMSLAVLSVCTGVYGIISNLTQVNIVIFLPDNFVSEVSFYINDSSRIELDISRKPESTKFHLFGM